MKKLTKVLGVTVVAGVGLLVGGLTYFEKNKEKLYEKYGKEEVLKFMERFEPLIIVDDRMEAAGVAETEESDLSDLSDAEDIVEEAITEGSV